jgi:hypothetical protein
MRSEDEVQNRIRYLLTQELERRIQEAGVRLPRRCVHNHIQPLDLRKQVDGEVNETYNRVGGERLPVIGLCMLGAEDPTEWRGAICEDPIDAQRCPYFDSGLTKEGIKEEFQTQIKDLKWLVSELPEVYGLLWALGSQVAPPLPWWVALWYRLLRVRPDPLVRVETPKLSP